MKGFLLIFVFISSFSHASSIPEDQIDKLQQIIKLFVNNSQGTALQLLKTNEQVLLKSIEGSKDSDSYFLLGKAYFYAEMDIKSENMFKNALYHNAKLSKAHYYIGLINMFSGSFLIAEESFQKAIFLDDSNDHYFVELARMQEKLEKPKEALSNYEKALKINETNYNANFNSANIYMEENNESKAEIYYLRALKVKPDNVLLNYNLGQLYQNLTRHDLAIKHLSKVVELDGSDWRAVAKLIQENQKLDNTLERDKSISYIYELWAKNEVKELTNQGFFIREQSDTAEGKLYALEYFQLVGDYAKKFVFKIQNPKTGESIIDISLGSYNSTTQISRETGSIAADERVYHLDGYLPNGNHLTYAFFNELPNYDLVRKMVFDVLAGKHKAVSSTVPSND